MRVLVITWNYPPRRGGIEHLLKNLCTGLREKHKVFIITSFAKAPHSIEPDTFRTPLPGLVPFAIYALWRGATLLARDRQIRVIFGGSALVTPLVVLLARVFRRRAVVLTHGLDVVHRNFLYQWLCVHWLRFCDRVVANSNYTAGLLRSKDVVPERITVIPPGVDAELLSIRTDVAATKRLWNIDGKKIILSVGRLAKRKGIKEFIETSLVEIVRDLPEAVFLIVGDNPTESLVHRDNVVGEISEAVSRLRLEHQVRLLGAVDDDELIKLYQASDVVVVPALDLKDDIEGFGIVALEAAAAGKPVVATGVGGISDAVEDRKGGILVEPGDYQALSHAILRILRDSSLAHAVGKAGRQRAVNLFSWREICQSYANIFNSTISAAD